MAGHYSAIPRFGSAYVPLPGILLESLLCNGLIWGRTRLRCLGLPIGTDRSMETPSRLSDVLRARIILPADRIVGSMVIYTGLCVETIR